MENKKELKFNLENFEGPIDLLLHLVNQKKIDIRQINVLDLANQYLYFIDQVKNNQLDEASEYLVMATSLLLLKARLTVQDPREKEMIKAEKERLLEKIIEYQQFKIAKKFLKTKEEKGLKILYKQISDLRQFDQAEDPFAPLTGKSSPVALVSSIRKMLERTAATIHGQSVLDFDVVSPEDQIEGIRKLLEEKKEFFIFDVMKKINLAHFLANLLALFEMSKNQEILIEQKKEFGELIFRLRKKG